MSPQADRSLVVRRILQDQRPLPAPPSPVSPSHPQSLRGSAMAPRPDTLLHDSGAHAAAGHASALLEQQSVCAPPCVVGVSVSAALVLICVVLALSCWLSKKFLISVIKARNAMFRCFYQRVLKPHFFRMDPEKCHELAIKSGKVLGATSFTRGTVGVQFGAPHLKELEQTIQGVVFPNCVGLAAGFDKNADLIKLMPHVGFGFEEVGSITGRPCEGNPKPRVWRLPQSESLQIWFGLCNDGAEKIAQRLRVNHPHLLRSNMTKSMDKGGKNGRRQAPPFVTGISIAKTNCRETVEEHVGIQDYVQAYRELLDVGHYWAINVSCPNVYQDNGRQPFTEPEPLDKLLTALRGVHEFDRPTFVKIGPDLSSQQVDGIIDVCLRHGVTGMIISNLTKKREGNTHIHEEDLLGGKLPYLGGLSGKVVEDLTNQLIRYVYAKSGGKLVIVGVGGVFTAEDAYRKIRNGASLVQLITGMIYRGPQLISDIVVGLSDLLAKDGFTHISQAVGADVKQAGEGIKGDSPALQVAQRQRMGLVEKDTQETDSFIVTS
ncbi:unnamed protein product [Vitrella brassicaformis CCMP3155]|uniref:Dihydroorotate dehydrogenase (quinone), mitochondrial n=1 Tax=Vitrella brassicaformis (strain CCMP3155) TaxID=1169540 RepID=A0A0G4H017_VITBC|nr:unnamed protein product [Vitrella brassicaformis CCMP3155]|mmetsp:Transcript_11722/g.34154  ORF Transcript_11722/g.34154 Transcript_11722/m.34154 type:complete len:547 (-) Transcript_11722:486-2126(-)|eukprot:CEM36892.1 unnamed protein product [Vitrella brassicaformis CCMP3155]